MPMNPHPLTRTGGRTLSSMDYLDSYTSLAAELKRQGWFRKATGRLMMEFTFHLATFALGIVVVVNASNAWVWIGGVAISAIGATGISTNTHTSAHFATSDKRRLNL